MLSVYNLNKKYGSNIVLDNINFEIESGKIYGLLGRNGVGKTTLLKIMSNQIISYTGEVKLDSEIIKENQAATEQILFVSEFMIPDSMKSEKIKNVLSAVSALLPNWNEKYKDELLADFKLNPKTTLKKLSKGNRNLLSLIIGLASGAKYTLYDEPSVGLDANNRYKFYQHLMKSMEDSKRTAIISTHIIDEAENIFEDVIILEDSKVMLNDDISNIQEKALSITGPKGEVLRILDGKNIISEENIGALCIISVFDNISTDERQRLKNAGAEITNLPLQKLFIHLTNKEA
ncbi:ABC-2 type transport system ATP-binding protein [Peptoniphilus asaccharolyticus DSM 20463]|uniref:ABC-2 type transport system ATP-binding protein n=1 Tax=Peptoniphilus asaccharolyticus DSM 20463 TaxID=573058 RepID=A0A1W1V541_PEPAS|nr:ABC transporter ATP-binding protein [Peptoniphilus asaccharolyticus]MBL7576299.1 ABC transporter ATP-binding protein [Peptoniphilus asaccharolyticus]SMB88151.1 ABC-2 type transport system ATP-binding protein [Peptoniphilus asaccharolyticus DSM 20463]